MNAINHRLDDLAGAGASLGIKVSRVDLAAAIPSGAKCAFDYVLIASQQADRDIAEARTGAAMTALRATRTAIGPSPMPTPRPRRRSPTPRRARPPSRRWRTDRRACPATCSPSRIYYDRIGALAGQGGAGRYRGQRWRHPADAAGTGARNDHETAEPLRRRPRRRWPAEPRRADSRSACASRSRSSPAAVSSCRPRCNFWRRASATWRSWLPASRPCWSRCRRSRPPGSRCAIRICTASPIS